MIATTNPMLVPGKPSVWPQLEAFEWEVYRNHPRYQEIKDWVASGNTKPLVFKARTANKTLGAVLHFLRPNNIVKKPRTHNIPIVKVPGT